MKHLRTVVLLAILPLLALVISSSDHHQTPTGVTAVKTLRIAPSAPNISLLRDDLPPRRVLVPPIQAEVVSHQAIAVPAVVPQAIHQAVSRPQTAVRPRAVVRPSSHQTMAGTVASGGLWACIGAHESGNNPTTNTGNGYYGAFQFSASTWNAMHTGYARADQAPYSVQMATAQRAAAMGGIHNQFPSTSRACGG